MEFVGASPVRLEMVDVTVQQLGSAPSDAVARRYFTEIADLSKVPLQDWLSATAIRNSETTVRGAVKVTLSGLPRARSMTLRAE